MAEERGIDSLEKEYWDNISGEWLDPSMVRSARKEEMEEFRKHGVYVKVPVKTC